MSAEQSSSSEDYDEDNSYLQQLEQLTHVAAKHAAAAADEAAATRKEADALLAKTDAAKARAIHLAYRRSQRRSRSNSPTREVRKQRHPKEDAPLGFRRSTCPLGHCCTNSKCYVNLADPQVVWDKSRFSKPYTPVWKRKTQGRVKVPKASVSKPKD